jgi:hypothetical protein
MVCIKLVSLEIVSNTNSTILITFNIIKKICYLTFWSKFLLKYKCIGVAILGSASQEGVEMKLERSRAIEWAPN